MRAILSVSDKTGLSDFGRGLDRLGVELVSTGGTAKALADAGLPVRNVSDVTGFPEMMDGRVKTLHPAIHAGILARRSRPDDLEAIARHGITPVDLVVVNLYPFAKAAQNPDTRFDALVEEIDIGGPSLVRAAAKNFRDVLVVVDPADYAQVLEELARAGGRQSRVPLHADAESLRAYRPLRHDDCRDAADGGLRRRGDEAGGDAGGCRRQGLCVTARTRTRKHPGRHHAVLPAWDIHQGKELSYTNLLDLDAALRIALEFPEPVGVVIKHTNPCGVALGATIAEAYVRAREADPLSAFGGIVGLNRTLDVETARALTSTFIEAVIAPGSTMRRGRSWRRRPTCAWRPIDFPSLATLDSSLERASCARSWAGL